MYLNKDKELLELLLCLDSEIFKNQMGTIKNRETLTQRLLTLLDYDIWTLLAINSTIFNNANDTYFYQNF